jgi:hypothetical protein
MRVASIVKMLSEILAGERDNGHELSTARPQQQHDEDDVRYRRCSERQSGGKPWVCQWLVTHLRHEPPP